MGYSEVTSKSILQSKKPKLILLKYIMFALISIGFNLGSQFLVDFLINYSHEIYISMFVGTGVGLVVKYILDKKYIFFYETESAKKDFKTFFLYTGMGIITTAIFWGTELLFDLFVTYENAKYAGGFIGLIVGYTIKYLLDKKWSLKSNMNRYALWMLLLLSILLVAFGQIFLKPAVGFCLSQGVKFYCQLLGDHWIYCGVLSYGLSLILWLGTLKSFDLGFARHFTSLGYVQTYLASLIFLKETFQVRRLLGIISITFGAILLK